MFPFPFKRNHEVVIQHAGNHLCVYIIIIFIDVKTVTIVFSGISDEIKEDIYYENGQDVNEVHKRCQALFFRHYTCQEKTKRLYWQQKLFHANIKNY